MATAYPFDPSGTSAANRIVNEQHVITAVNFRDYHYVIPKFAPFFAESMVLRMQYPNGNVRTLTQGLDYYFSHQFLDASRACAKPVYGSISFLDTDEAGILSITYQTIGGIWTLSASEISRILAEQMRNPRITAWEQITYLPERFPIIDHEWDLIDMVGASEVVRAIDDITTTIANSTGGGLQTHVTNYSNPHNVTKAQVGLGNVQNYASATQAQAEAGSANNLFMTPLRVKQAIDVFGGLILETHASRVDNPHRVTKAQVGLGNVSNFPTATLVEAGEGIAQDRFMTPETTAHAIDVQVGADFDAHAANKANPHGVTKAQVGLFNVENFPVATAEEARLGTRADRYMTPQRTTQLMAEYVNSRLMDHELRIDNPHEVNKVQVGLGLVQNYAMADLSVATNPTSMSQYVSPAVAAAIARYQVEEYMSSAENPAGVTKAMVGLANVENYTVATQAQAEAGSVNNAYMTPLRTRQAIVAIAQPMIDLHATSTSNPHGVTKAQVGLSNVDNYATATPAQTSAGTATNLFVTPAGLAAALENAANPVTDAHIASKDNPHEVTAEQIGAVTATELNAALNNYLPRNSTDVSAMSREDFISMVMSGTAANSTQWSGYSPETYWEYLDSNRLDTSYVRSMDSDGLYSTTAGTNTARGAWVKIGVLTNDGRFPEDPSEPYIGQDAVFMVHGGQYWGSAISAGQGYTNMSPVFMVRAALASYGFGGDNAPRISVQQLAGFDAADLNTIEFGYTISSSDGKSTYAIYMATTRSHRPVVVNRLTPFGNSVPVETVTTAPNGIQYVTIDRSMNTAPLSQSITTLNNTATSHGDRLTATESSITNLNQRLAAIESLLASITVI